MHVSITGLQDRLNNNQRPDHASIILHLNLGIEEIKKYWRANISLLNEPAVTKEIKEYIQKYFIINDNRDVSQSVLWDSAKVTIRGAII